MPRGAQFAAQLEAKIFPELLQLGEQLDAIFQSRVQAGPFKGLYLPKHLAWGASARAALLLGIYEQDIQAFLPALSQRYSTFIDIGAADGYYTVGVLVNHL